MKKIFITVLISIFLINITYAKKINNKNYEMYIGNKIGLSHYNDLEKINNNFYENDIEKGKGFFIGYKNNKNLSFEIGYDWLGKITEKKKFINKSFNTQGINLINKINLPISKKIDIYTKLGSMITKSTYHEKNKIKKKEIFYNDIRLSPLFSIGIEYKINPLLISRLDYQIIPNIGNKIFLKEQPTNNFFNISFIYKYKKNKIKKYNKNYIFNIKINKNISLNNNDLNKIFKNIIFLNKYIYKIKIINFYKKEKVNKIKLFYKNIKNIEKYFLNKGINYFKINKKICNFTNIKNITNNIIIKIKIIK